MVKTTKKLDTNSFIFKASKKHNNKYLYDLVEYKTTKTPIIIQCKLHGFFKKRPDCHLRGQGCIECSKKKTSNKLKDNSFVEKASLLFNNKFDYSKVNYINNKTPVTIICKIHGEFNQTPKAHLKGKFCCPKCSKNTKLTIEDFKIKASKIHNNFYKYSFKELTENVIIYCPKHGDFIQKYKNHLKGYGCKLCAKIKQKSARTKYTFSDFKKRAKKIHNNKYIYSEVEYKNINTKIKIICLKHGSFYQTPNLHLNSKQGCLDCSGKAKITKNKFIEMSNKAHNNKYCYDNVIYKTRYDKVKIICLKHGEFHQTPKNHLKGRGCYKCFVSTSKKEKRWIDSFNNINIIPQYKIIIKNKTIIVDGYDPKTNTIYEFYGDYWHGYPFKRVGINKKCNKSFNTLYYKTIEKEQILENNNYNIVSIWESDFDRMTNG